MDKSEKNMDKEEQRIEKLADDINPKEDKSAKTTTDQRNQIGRQYG